jgi:RecB family endonuclease NucS
VLLTDRKNSPVIVECKQGTPEIKHLKQIRHYMARLKAETGKTSRGIFWFMVGQESFHPKWLPQQDVSLKLKLCNMP